jgi:hypothetical protein
MLRLLFVFAFALCAFAQYDEPMPLNEPKIPADLHGKIHTISKKEITLDRGDENVMPFSITRKTRFFKEGKEVKWKAFQRGDEVTIEALEDFPGHFSALVVKNREQSPQTQ